MLLFNVWHGNERLAELRDAIERRNADLVVMLEATNRIRDALQSPAYPYRLDCMGASRCNLAIASRSPVLAREARGSDRERASLLIAETEVAGCRLTLLVTHMTRPFPFRPPREQRAQAEEIARQVGAVVGAKLVLGDFNAAPWGHVARKIAERGAVTLLTGAGGTWPSFLPGLMRIPIDHLFAGSGLSFVSRQVLPDLGSDHVPVLAEIAVTDPIQCR